MIEKREVYKYSDAFEKSKEYFGGEELPAKVFLDKYALRDNDLNLLEATPEDMFNRIATEIARIEKNKFKKPYSFEEIKEFIRDFKRIVPQGSPMYGLGNPYQYVSLSNCFVIEPPVDSYGGICLADQEIVQISKRRGGVGTDISNLRPGGSATTNAARTSTGIISFMERYSSTIREVGQCLHNDTLIMTFYGLKRISEVLIGDKVWTKEGWVRVSGVVSNKKPCIKIRTKHGKEIICSKDHVFHMIHGECRAKEFRLGDKITQIVGEGWEGKNILFDHGNYKKDNYNNSNRLNEDISIPRVMDDKLSYVVGYSYGDGCVEKQKNGENTCLSLACSDDWEEIKTKLSCNIKEIFNYDVKIKSRDEACESLRIFSRVVLDFLEKNNILKQKAGDLIFPDKILSAKQNIIFSFLSGYFDADGCAQISKKVYKIASIDKDFLIVIQNILSAFGVVSRIYKQVRNNKNWRDIYSLSINGGKSQEMFRGLMSQSVKISNTIINDKYRDFTRSIYKTSDFKTNSSRHSYIGNNDQYLSYSVCDKLKNDLKISKNTYLLQDEICSIEEYSEGEEQLVYDICLDKEHLFFANGLYVHNSGRRGALLISISIHHPEILEFTKAKRDLTKVTGANISIRLTDEFLNAVKNNTEYEQRFPVDSNNPEISNMVKAKDVWQEIIENAHAMAEPGLLFWDTIIRESLADCYADLGFKTVSTNPCGEITLCANDSCRLLLLNLFNYVEHPFTKKAFFNHKKFKADAKIAQRIQDDIIDLEREALQRIVDKIKKDPEEKRIKEVEINLWEETIKKCESGRRTGTGITALGDTLAAIGVRYGSKKSIEVVDNIYKTLKLGCYESSVEMAKELGPFPIWDPKREKDNPFLLRIKAEDRKLYRQMQKYGRRNIAIGTTAPAGSCSILTQTTSGIEPCFMISYKRRKKINQNDENIRVDYIDQTGDRWQEFDVFHPTVKKWMEITGETDITKSPWYGCCADDINWLNRVKLQAIANKHVDHSISSCITSDSLIETENGLFYFDELTDLENIDENSFRENNKEVNVLNHNMDMVKLDEYYNNGKKQTLSLKLLNGLEIRCTSNEKFIVLNDEDGIEEWKKISEIKEGDKIKIKNIDHRE